MSFRELRHLSEILLELGYPQLVPVDSFRSSNFELVADILFWLVSRYDPSYSVSDEISTEDDRVEFLVQTARFMAIHAGIRLNIKRLYAADGYAARELLKVAEPLESAVRAAFTGPTTVHDVGTAGPLDSKAIRDLASDISNIGSGLFHILGSGDVIENLRNAGSTAKLDRDEIEKAVESKTLAVRDRVSALSDLERNLQTDEDALTKKIDKRTQELDRATKRLHSLEHVRPQFMDEYEALEGELAQLYDAYLQKQRNIDFLESELSDFRRMEKEQVEEAEREMKRLQKKAREEELRLFRGENANGDFEVASVKERGRGAGFRPRSQLEGDILQSSSSSEEDASDASGSESEDEVDLDGDLHHRNDMSDEVSSSTGSQDTDSESEEGPSTQIMQRSLLRGDRDLGSGDGREDHMSLDGSDFSDADQNDEDPENLSGLSAELRSDNEGADEESDEDDF